LIFAVLVEQNISDAASFEKRHVSRLRDDLCEQTKSLLMNLGFKGIRCFGFLYVSVVMFSGRSEDQGSGVS
jgi:hypothetical protein